MPFTAVNIVFFMDKTKSGDLVNPYLQAGGRRFESDYLHEKGHRLVSVTFFRADPCVYPLRFAPPPRGHTPLVPLEGG